MAAAFKDWRKKYIATGIANRDGKCRWPRADQGARKVLKKTEGRETRLIKPKAKFFPIELYRQTFGSPSAPENKRRNHKKVKVCGHKGVAVPPADDQPWDLETAFHEGINMEVDVDEEREDGSDRDDRYDGQLEDQYDDMVRVQDEAYDNAVTGQDYKSMLAELAEGKPAAVEEPESDPESVRSAPGAPIQPLHRRRGLMMVDSDGTPVGTRGPVERKGRPQATSRGTGSGLTNAQRAASSSHAAASAAPAAASVAQAPAAVVQPTKDAKDGKDAVAASPAKDAKGAVKSSAAASRRNRQASGDDGAGNPKAPKRRPSNNAADHAAAAGADGRAARLGRPGYDVVTHAQKLVEDFINDCDTVWSPDAIVSQIRSAARFALKPELNALTAKRFSLVDQGLRVLRESIRGPAAVLKAWADYVAFIEAAPIVPEYRHPSKLLAVVNESDLDSNFGLDDAAADRLAGVIASSADQQHSVILAETSLLRTMQQVIDVALRMQRGCRALLAQHTLDANLRDFVDEILYVFLAWMDAGDLGADGWEVVHRLCREPTLNPLIDTLARNMKHGSIILKDAIRNCEAFKRDSALWKPMEDDFKRFQSMPNDASSRIMCDIIKPVKDWVSKQDAGFQERGFWKSEGARVEKALAEAIPSAVCSALKDARQVLSQIVTASEILSVDERSMALTSLTEDVQNVVKCRDAVLGMKNLHLDTRCNRKLLVRFPGLIGSW